MGPAGVLLCPEAAAGGQTGDLRLSPVALLLIPMCGHWNGAPGANQWPSQINRKRQVPPEDELSHWSLLPLNTT